MDKKATSDMNPRKLLRQAMQSPNNLRFEALQLAEAFGFRHVRTSGSHYIFSRNGIPQLVNLQSVGGKSEGISNKAVAETR